MNNNHYEPLIPASTQLPEFTFKSVLLSIILAIILSAANAYLALKIGTTVSASIPASVLAIGILRFFKNSNVLESNLIQTAASAGEGLAAALSFVLPAMVIMQIWAGFPYGETVIVTLLGGLLGVLFSVPLRRVLLNLPNLRFPEGTAIGNVLKVSTEGGKHLGLLIKGSTVGALVSFLQNGLKVITDNLQMWMFTTKSVFGYALGFTPAVLASGYIVGLQAGISLFTGTVIGWIILLPIIGHIAGVPQGVSAYDAASNLWSTHLRFVGVGTMIVGGFWTLLSLLKPIGDSIKFSLRSLRKKNDVSETILRTEFDMPIKWVLWSLIFLSLLLFVFVFLYLIHGSFASSSSYLWVVAVATVIFVIIIGFLIATIAGYFCGIVGSSNNPLSGLLITAILLLSVVYLLIFHGFLVTHAKYVASTVIIVATVIAGIGAISGENIQDLKAGHMVGATPWRQQLMMAVGVIVSALVLGPVLQLLFNAYGMGGVFPHPGMNHAQMLAAPQAGLMAAVAQGVISRNLDWSMIGTGAVVAVVIIIIDEFLKKKNKRLPTLAVGLGIYIPPEVIFTVFIGSVVSALVKKPWGKASRTAKEEQVIQERYHSGVLLACGIVAGSALMGVILAIPFVIMGSANALAIDLKGFVTLSHIVSVLVFLSLCYWLYRVGKTKQQKL
jgi:putative OPT family oligopeptide transporter